MKCIPDELLRRYLSDPLALDGEVRKQMQVPDDRFYSVSVWPVAGRLSINKSLTRVGPKAKISKSDQK